MTGMPGPARDDLGDVLGVDLLLEEHGPPSPPASRAHRPRLVRSASLLLELGNLAVAQLGSPLEVGFALGALGLAARGLLEALLGLAHRLRSRRFSLLPLRLHLRRALAQL